MSELDDQMKAYAAAKAEGARRRESVAVRNPGSDRVEAGAESLIEDWRATARYPRSVTMTVLAAADEADRANGIVRVDVRDESTIEKVAEAMALEGDEDGCFECIREFEELDETEADDFVSAHGYPVSDYEQCEYWRNKATAVLAALEEGTR